MKKNKEDISKRNKQAKLMILAGSLMIITLTISILVVSLKNSKNNEEPDEKIDTLNGNSLVDYDENTLNLEVMPFIRLNYYDEETGVRSGLMISNDGNIYKFSFNETKVKYPDSDKFIINQTIYFDNIVEEYGNIGEHDLTLLKEYAESIKYEYANDEIVFDTVGNSISVTNYMNEENIVLINSEGVKNINENTDRILEILEKYNIKI